jgi:glycerol-3-phosphate acyltransferase PlsY
MIFAQYFLVILIGYLLGSLPSGLLVSRYINGADVRQIGSGRTGMTNVMRASGFKAGLIVLLLDLSKGAVAVLLARLIFATNYESAQVLAAFAAISGHSWSIFLKFQGGRGVACFIGGLLAMYPLIAVIGGVITIIVAILSKYMSLGSITGAVAAYVILIPLYIMRIYPVTEYLIYAMIGAIFIMVMHRDNIKRLLDGTERRLGEKFRVNATLPNP